MELSRLSSCSSRPRTYSASDRPSQYLSPLSASSTLTSYSFPPAPRTADPVVPSSFKALPERPTPSTPSFVETSPEPQFSYEPPLLSHFLPHQDRATYRDYEPRSYEPRTEERGGGGHQYGQEEEVRGAQFSTLGQAIYDGRDARQILSSFSFSKLLTPYPPHEDQLPPPPYLAHRSSRIESPVYHRRPLPPPMVHLPDPSEHCSPSPPPKHSPRPHYSVSTSRRSDSPRQTDYSFPSPIFTPRPAPRPASLHNPLLPHRLQSRNRPSHRPSEKTASKAPDSRRVISAPSSRKLLFAPPAPAPRPSAASRNASSTPRLPSIITTPPTTFAPPPQASSSSSSKPPKSLSLPKVSSSLLPKANGSRSSSTSRSSVGIFRPSPQSMLAPEAVRLATLQQQPLFITQTLSLSVAGNHQSQSHSRGAEGGEIGGGGRGGRAWNAPLIPKGLDFDRLPTKSSRGRKPRTLLGFPRHDSTTAVEQGDEIETLDERQRGGGFGDSMLPQGRKKKTFVCKVKDCGKVFKRGEHLQRHVRSIHTGEKPFQCQWPGCGKYFSRHDNLNQHLRVHKSPNQSIEEFSAQIAECFNRRLEQVERESREICKQVQEQGLASLHAGEAGEAREGEGREGESIYSPPPATGSNQRRSEEERRDETTRKKRRTMAGSTSMSMEKKKVTRDYTSSDSDNHHEQEEERDSPRFASPPPPQHRRTVRPEHRPESFVFPSPSMASRST
ncbi:C2H2-type zinc finger protein [Sporobolomyces salmoneus]|uniref:C2H2-type zinc finger protein n=1 Tax=Sporobolomyces salmoneus TaxID=183962 RepID=UPI0031790536